MEKDHAEVEAELLKERMPQRCRNSKTAMRRQQTMMRDIILVRGDSMRFRSPLSFSLFPFYLLHCPATRFVRFPSCVRDQLIDGSTPLEWIVVVALVVVNASPLAIVLYFSAKKKHKAMIR